jgi:hypothetical protein
MLGLTKYLRPLSAAYTLHWRVTWFVIITLGHLLCPLLTLSSSLPPHLLLTPSLPLDLLLSPPPPPSTPAPTPFHPPSSQGREVCEVPAIDLNTFLAFANPATRPKYVDPLTGTPWQLPDTVTCPSRPEHPRVRGLVVASQQRMQYGATDIWQPKQV